ncbi:MAG: zinc-binding dehydrogenase [Candidatus Competibacteraceae bacterium]|jgi:NADPH:quinone reductase-like Zn-dependent oxidoreductase|nr:zinc-binding dehydrogenase [Candidatus Competibacteraceae bacterium]
MRAVVLPQTGGPNQLRIEQVKTPTPEPGQVRVALRAAALNRRDVWISLGLYPRIQLPCILGSDGAGIIDQIGDGIDQQWIGREVVIYPAYDWGDDPRFPGPTFRVLGMPDPGTFADFICVPVEHVFPKPAHLSWEQAAAIPLAGLTAWRAIVTQSALQPGEKVLVTGIGGGVATFALKWAVALGAQVFVTSGHLDKIDRAMALGAVAGVNYHASDWAQQVLKLSGGLDVIIDGTGGAAFNGYLSLLKPAGRIIVYGATAGNPPEGPELARLFFRQLQIRGSTMGSLSEFSEMLAFVAARCIEPVIDKVFPLEEASAAHRHLQATAQMGKVVLRHM